MRSVASRAVRAGLGALLCGCTAVPTEAPRAPSSPVVVKVIGFNDFHGNLQSPGTFGVDTAVPLAARPPVGGADYLAAAVARLKARNPFNVVVGAGDFIGASPLVSALFFDEPAVETLNRIGVEFTAVGNHEFDKGAAELRRLQNGGCKLTAAGVPEPNSCKGLGSAVPGRFDGARFRWLSANVVDAASGATLFAPYAIKRFGAVQIAFIGMTLRATPAVVTPTGVAGLRFLDEAGTVNALVPRLRAQGVEGIVVLVHQGGAQAASGPADINGCDAGLRNADGSDSEIGRIVARLDDAVDLVISGHTHAAYNCSAGGAEAPSAGTTATETRPTRTPRPAGLPNRNGRLVPVTSASAFGRVLTDVDMTFEPGRRGAVRVTATNRLVDRTDPALTAPIRADPSVKAIVDGYAALAAPLANQVAGSIATALPSAADDAGEMPAGDLIADAQLQATQPAALGGAVIAFTNPGGVRNPGFAVAGASYPYALSFADAFKVQPFGNSLVTMTLTARQIKALLEQQFAGCHGQTAQRILQVSNGLRYSWRASAPPCAKIVDATLTPTDLTRVPPLATAAPEVIVKDGVVPTPERRYRVTVNSFMAAGGDDLAVLKNGADVQGGAQDIDALTAYLAGYRAPRPPYRQADAAFGRPRITRLP